MMHLPSPPGLLFVFATFAGIGLLMPYGSHICTLDCKLVGDIPQDDTAR
ncbi:MAG: hypothetical protein K8F33_00460 [Thermomonas sp.]|nr:hypothetical protein [Thermomonas sp.]MBZ0086565.1 hypothetical protein [Thermomonas sp.]MCO5055281.1 hypothetical protein [Thermomonas sp.]